MIKATFLESKVAFEEMISGTHLIFKHTSNEWTAMIAFWLTLLTENFRGNLCV